MTINESVEFTRAVDAADQYYQIPVESGVSYAIEVFNGNASGNFLYATLLDNDLNRLVEREQVGREYIDTLEITPSFTGNIYLLIESGTNSFLRYTVSPYSDSVIQDSTSYEPNGVRSIAYPVQFGATYLSELSPADQSDWYAIDVQSGDIVNAAIGNNTSSSLTLRYRLYDMNGAPLMPYEFLATDGETTTMTVNFTGPLYLEVLPINFPSEPRSYSVNFSM